MFSIEMVLKRHIPINDAIHLYTACAYKPEIEEFICSDRILIKATEKEVLNVSNPEE